MKRTQNRALVTGDVSVMAAFIFAFLLGIAGLASLIVCTNLLTTTIGVVAVFFYVIVYGYAKRISIHGTLIGSIPGALPPVAGYTAVTGKLDATALTLFLILVFWQMPHFYAIAIYRKKEYIAAKLPLLPIVKGMRRTRTEIILYIILFFISAIALVPIGGASLIYGVIMLILSVFWIRLALTKTKPESIDRWAKKVFGFSLLVLLIFSVVLSLNWLLP